MSNIRITPSQPAPLALEVRPAPREGLARWRSTHENGIVDHRPGIFMTQAAYQSISQHAARTFHLEVGGMLVGQAYLSPAHGLYIVVEGSLEAQHVNHGPVHLTFTSEALADMLNRLEESYPGKQIVGWYHTHPGLSIFLSSMDVWLHTHFFPQPWHVALVIDPQANHGGFFSYVANQPGNLDAHGYVGFYELGVPGADSVVTWLNLAPDEIAFTGTLWEETEIVED